MREILHLRIDRLDTPIGELLLRLDDSIKPWIPELANRRVLKSISSDLDDTVPALRPITLRDLLTYWMGFGSVMAMPNTYPIQKLIREYRIGGDGPMLPSEAPGMDEWLQKLGSLPLLAQPVQRPRYSRVDQDEMPEKGKLFRRPEMAQVS